MNLSRKLAGVSLSSITVLGTESRGGGAVPESVSCWLFCCLHLEAVISFHRQGGAMPVVWAAAGFISSEGASWSLNLPLPE